VNDYGLLDLIGQRAADPAMLGVMMRLFDGNPVAALRMAKGWMPARRTARRTAFTAHLLGVTMVGSYPFRGIAGACACPERNHVCSGRGCTYLCFDVDDHDGRGDMQELLTRVVVELRRWSLSPLVCTSRSGTGAHAFVFLDGQVDTADAAAVGRWVVAGAKARGRVDVIPSARHGRGFGTAHALPLFPGAADVGGGIVLDERLRASTDTLGALMAADRSRASAMAFKGLAQAIRAGQIATPGVLGTRSSDGKSETYTASARSRACLPVPGGTPRNGSRPEWVGPQPERARSKVRSPRRVVAAMADLHPQFKQALETPGDQWVGGRSARDAYLVGFLARQGLSPQQIALTLGELPGTKTAERGPEFALELAAHRERTPAPDVVLAGTVRSERPRRGSPWVDRAAPPLDYDGEPNPWWSVRDRLKDRTGRIDGVVLAYLIDRWYRGALPRRTFYLGVRGLGTALALPQSTVAASLKRLGEKFADVLTITQGVPHPSLRVATAFGVVGAWTADRIPFGQGSGQSGQPRICCVHDRDGDAALQPDAPEGVADWHPGPGEGHGVGAAASGAALGTHAAP
jgi:hypothetical protein